MEFKSYEPQKTKSNLISKTHWGCIYLKVLKCQFFVYILIRYSERKQISQYACPKKKEMRTNWQTFKFSCQSLAGKARTVTIMAKLVIFLTKNETLNKCLLTCLWSSNRRYLYLFVKFYMLCISFRALNKQ